MPSETGRALSSGRTRRVGLLLTDLENQFYPHVISPMHHELESLGYQLVLQTESSDTGSGGRAADRQLPRRGAAGHHHLDSVLPVRLRDRRMPFVYFNRTTDAVEADSATVDPEPGITELADEIVATRPPADRGDLRTAATPAPPSSGSGRSAPRSGRAWSDDPRPSARVRGPFDFDTGYDGTASAAGTGRARRR